MSTSSEKIISDLTVECCHHKIIHFRMLSSLVCDVIILHSVISGSPMALPELCWLYCQLENLGFFSTIKNMFTLVMFLDEWWGTTLGNCCSNPSCEKWEGKHVRIQCKGIVSKKVQWTQKCNDGTNTENDCLKCLLCFFVFFYNNKALNHGCDKHIHSSNLAVIICNFCVRFPHTTLVQLLCLLNLNLTNVLYGTWPGVLLRFGGSSYKV